MNPTQPFKWLVNLFRRSLQARAVAFTVILSGFALVILGGFLSYSIGNGLYQTRLQQVLAESSRAIGQTQNTLSASSVSDEVSLQTLINTVIPSLEIDSATQSRKIALLRSPTSSTPASTLQSPISADLDITVISDELRDLVTESPTQVNYQSVMLYREAVQVPGLVVGSQLEVPVAGTYELYMVYDLHTDQQTLDFVQRTMAVGGMILILIIGLVAYFVANLLVKPVGIAAEVAKQIEQGDLSRRIPGEGQDVIAKLAKSFNQMAGNLESKILDYERVSQMQQRFVSDVSHELRTPLASIKLASSQIFKRRAKLDPELARFSEMMDVSVDRFNKLLNDLLEISRYDAGAVHLDVEYQDITGTVGMAIQSVEQIAKSHGSKINVHLPDGMAECEHDAHRIERVLRNLLSNAIEHGEAKPIDVAVGVSQSAVAVTVTDQGVGMTQEQLSHVFDRFWRADASRVRTIGGTGLGMAISSEDVQLHHGWLQVWSEPNKGASFRMTLPRTQNSVLRNSPLPMPPAPKVAAKSAEAKPAVTKPASTKSAVTKPAVTKSAVTKPAAPKLVATKVSQDKKSPAKHVAKKNEKSETRGGKDA